MGKIIDSVIRGTRRAVQRVTPSSKVETGGYPEAPTDAQDTIPLDVDLTVPAVDPDPFRCTRIARPDQLAAAGVRGGMSPEAIEAALRRVMEPEQCTPPSGF